MKSGDLRFFLEAGTGLLDGDYYMVEMYENFPLYSSDFRPDIGRFETERFSRAFYLLNGA